MAPLEAIAEARLAQDVPLQEALHQRSVMSRLADGLRAEVDGARLVALARAVVKVAQCGCVTSNVLLSDFRDAKGYQPLVDAMAGTRDPVATIGAGVLENTGELVDLLERFGYVGAHDGKPAVPPNTSAATAGAVNPSASVASVRNIDAVAALVRAFGQSANSAVRQRILSVCVNVLTANRDNYLTLERHHVLSPLFEEIDRAPIPLKVRCSGRTAPPRVGAIIQSRLTTSWWCARRLPACVQLRRSLLAAADTCGRTVVLLRDIGAASVPCSTCCN